MLASLFRPHSGRHPSHESGVSPHSRGRRRRVRTETYHDEEQSEEEADVYEDEEEYDEHEEEIEDEDGEEDPLLPIFSAEVLGQIRKRP
jgi:hypothetical protein